MTLTQYPEGVQKSGSTGGTTHSHGRYGSYTKNRTRPVNPNTKQQSKTRCTMCFLAHAWKETLTQDQRDAWNLYGTNVLWENALGKNVHLTGFAQFTRSNSPRLDVDVPIVLDGPTIFNVATPVIHPWGGASTFPGLEVLVCFEMDAPWRTEDGAYLFASMTKPYNSGIKFYNGAWRSLGYLAGEVGSPWGPCYDFAPVFPIAAGQRVGIKSRISRADGRLSKWAYTSCIVQ